MTIDKLAEALMLLRQHKLDDADVILLGELLNRWKEGKVTIMQLLENTIVGC